MSQLIALLFAILPYMSPVNYGAVGDGVADDTVALQRAINAASKHHVVLAMRPGAVHLTGQLELPPTGLRIAGNGATLRMLDDQPRFCRLLETHARSKTLAEDAPPIVVEHLRFDMNRSNQGVYEHYQKEHQAGIFVAGQRNSPHLVQMIVRDCEFVESAGDGIHVNCNARVIVENCRFHEIFRAAVAQTGGWSECTIKNCKVTGDRHVPRIDHEPDGAGYGDSLATKLTVLDCDSGPGGQGIQLDTAIWSGSEIHVVRTNLLNPNLVGGHGTDGNLTISDCRIRSLGSRKGWVRRLHRAQFRNVRFHAFGEDGSCVHVFHDSDSDQKIEFLDCTFTAGSKLAVDGIAVNPQDTHFRDARVVARHCDFDDSINNAYSLDRSGALQVTGGTYDCKALFWFQATAPRETYLRVDDLHLESGDTAFFSRLGASGVHSIAFHNVSLTEAQNKIETLVGAPIITGSGRTILGTRDPTQAPTPGFERDRFRHGAREWTCIESGANAKWLSR
jgi:hypothetical protein